MENKDFKIKGEDIKALIPEMGYGFATDMIMVDGLEITYMYREKTKDEEDSGWRFFSGFEDQAYVDDPKNTAIYKVNTIANYDPDIIQYLSCEAPCAFEKKEGTEQYKRVEL